MREYNAPKMQKKTIEATYQRKTPRGIRTKETLRVLFLDVALLVKLGRVAFVANLAPENLLPRIRIAWADFPVSVRILGRVSWKFAP